MVAILKLIISVALLSQASAAAIQKRAEPSVQVDDPVLATETVDAALPVETADTDATDATSADDLELRKRLAIVSSVISTGISTPTNAAVALPTGLLVVGEPVLVTRIKLQTSKIRVTRATSTAADALSIAPSATADLVNILIGKLIVGDPVLAVRPTKAISKLTTLATSVVQVVPTAISL